MENRQSAAKDLPTVVITENDQSSETISLESTENIILGKQPVYLKKRNVIYKITNLVNNKIYIGSASFYDKRIGTHVNLLRKNNHKNPYLQSTWNKYGEENFEFSIIEEVEDQQKLLEREQYWLDYNRSYENHIGYNISKIAGSNLGNKLSEDTKKKIGDFWKGKKHSEERKKATKERVTKLQGKKVLIYDENMNFVIEVNSITNAAKYTNLSIACVSKGCSNKLKGRSYSFRYKDIVQST